MAHQVDRFYADLSDESMTNGLALVHQRATVRILSQPGTWRIRSATAHNGEINTLRGNINWMHARESQMRSDLPGRIYAKYSHYHSPRQ